LTVEQVSSGGKVQYLHHDQAGSTRLITGETGSVEGKCSYSPYGTPTCEGSATSPLGYDGEYTNSDTGLQYLRARSYDPSTGQFTSSDPIAPLTGEPYSFAGDSPLMYSDPLGLDFGDELEEFGEEVGEGVTGFGDEAANTLTFGAEPNTWIREQLGLAQPDFCSANYKAGGIAGLGYASAIPIERIPSVFKFITEGREIKIGKNWRFAPFGNRRGGIGRFPHYHRRGEGPGQGIGRHRPWETKPGDEIVVGTVLMFTPPILVIDSGNDVIRFDSTQDAAKWVEPIDVNEGEYEFFDSQGQRLTAVQDDKWVVDLVAHTPPQWDSELLASYLRTYLEALARKRKQPMPDVQMLDLDSLVGALPSNG
jgi:RHS repeat-associated protein